MKAYHLRTIEPDKYDPMSFDTFTLDSIYVPEKKILVGFIDWKNRKGKVLNYTEIHHDRAQYIVEGNKNNVQGKVISHLELDALSADKIAKNPFEYQVKLTKKFDSQTNTLVEILTGKSMTIMSKIKKYLFSSSGSNLVA